MRGVPALMVVLIGLAAPGFAAAAEIVSFVARDRVTVFADYYLAASKAKPLVLLFHQAGSNRGEYATIAPVLVGLGFNALAVDPRAGGNSWGRANETVQHLGHSAGFTAALADLEAAVQWARASGHTGKLIVWGSSYSAALVFLLAAEHQDEIAAILAFSPGEYLGGTDRVRHAASQISMPIFVASAKQGDEIAAARMILDAAPAAVKTQFVPRSAGIHGSSTLRADRNPAGAEENWNAVKDFLGKLSGAV
jgi:dienelactone hydrolase